MISNSTDGQVDRKRLEQIRGFLIYVSRTYPWMPPYLKGLHLTIDSWRPGRNEQGFKLKASELRSRPYVQWDWDKDDWVDLTPDEYAKLTGRTEGPDRVRLVDRLRRDVECLKQLTAGEKPSLV